MKIQFSPLNFILFPEVTQGGVLEGYMAPQITARTFTRRKVLAGETYCMACHVLIKILLHSASKDTSTVTADAEPSSVLVFSVSRSSLSAGGAMVQYTEDRGKTPIGVLPAYYYLEENGGVWGMAL